MPAPSPNPDWPDQHGYCDVDDVAANNQYATGGTSSTYDDTTRPTADQVNRFIADLSWRVDARLQQLGIALPVATDAQLGVLRYWVAMGAAGKAAMSTEMTFNQTERSHGDKLLFAFDRWLGTDSAVLKEIGATRVPDVITSGLNNSDPNDVTGQTEKAAAFTRTQVW